MNKKIVALIPARGGSKGIPKKNIKNFAGKPLIYWSCLSVQLSSRIDKGYVATDDEDIKRVVEDFGFSKIKVIERSAESATDTAPTELVLLEFCQKYNFDIAVLVQPTSPLLTHTDLDKAIESFLDSNCDSMLSCVRQKRFIWHYDKKERFFKPANYDYKDRPRRQDFAGFYVENGAFYITSRVNILKYKNRLSGKIGIYEMPEYTYHELDAELDWAIAENLAYNVIPSYFNYWIRPIKLLCLDVDGVLTDGGVYYSDKKEELLKFNRIDGKGLELIRQVGIDVIIISSESSYISKKRADKLKIDNVFLGIKDKLSLLQDYCWRKKLNSREVCFMGDDVQDLPVIEWVGFSAAPLNAVDIVKNKVLYLCRRKGGEGAVREVVDLILKIKKQKED